MQARLRLKMASVMSGDSTNERRSQSSFTQLTTDCTMVVRMLKGYFCKEVEDKGELTH